MLRKAQSTLEYVYLLAIMAAAIIAMLVYMKRGFQGNLRGQAEQIGAGYYDPKNTSVDSVETKRAQSTVVSESVSTTTYGAPKAGSTSVSSSSNTEEGTQTVDRQTNENLGSLSNDTWH